jgi:peptide/nickel transport system permease protein
MLGSTRPRKPSPRCGRSWASTAAAERYLAWVGGMLTGDFGTSYTYRVPVSELMLDRLWVSLPLALYALTLSTADRLSRRHLAAANRGGIRRLRRHGRHAARHRDPEFLVRDAAGAGLRGDLRWFSAGGFPGWDGRLLAAMKALTLPAIALALPQASILARVMRSRCSRRWGEDYIRTARAKGLAPPGRGATR